MVPIGVGTSVSTHIAACLDVIEEAGLAFSLHSYGTTVEGEMSLVLGAIRLCHERMHSMGAPRVHTNIRLGTRIDREQSMHDKIKAVEEGRSISDITRDLWSEYLSK